MEVNEVRRLRDLEEENRHLKKLVADLSLDKMALEEVLKKIWASPCCCAASGAWPERTPILSSGGSAAFHAPLQIGSVTGDRVAAEDAGAGRSASSLWPSAIACSAQA